ncbi:MAG: type II toxin-antitoxin system PemK/MazF family toxin [Alphaproteobacteria bacterium]
MVKPKPGRHGIYQPDRGDFVYLDFTPHAGTEQAGRRPALVLSPFAFNVGTGLMFVCPVTNQVKGGSFEVSVPRGAKINGVILSHQLRSLDWIVRNADFHSKAPDATVLEVLARIEAVLGLELDL